MIKIKTLATGSKGNCYHITDGHTPLLLEAGIRFKDIQRQLNFNISDISACLITHEHKDHCMALKDVLKMGIDCYMSAGTKEALSIENHRLKVVESRQQFSIGTWTILPFDVQHDVSEPLGFLLANKAGEKLLFATDTYYIKYRFKGITHLLVECNYDLDTINANVASGKIHPAMKRRVMRSHFSLENLLDFIKANDMEKLQEIHLLHLSDSNSNEEKIRREVARLTGTLIYIP